MSSVNTAMSTSKTVPTYSILLYASEFENGGWNYGDDLTVQFLEVLKAIRTTYKRTSMPIILLYGPGGCGKTYAMEKLIQQHHVCHTEETSGKDQKWGSIQPCQCLTNPCSGPVVYVTADERLLQRPADTVPWTHAIRCECLDPAEEILMIHENEQNELAKST